MRIFNKFRHTKGYISTWERVLRFRYMITEEAKKRVRILAFWEKHGDAPASEAFKVSLRSLYRWQAALKESGGKLEGLNPASTAPRQRRRRNIPDDVSTHIIALRTAHPRLGKDKVHAMLTQRGYRGSVSTIGRILSDLKKQGKLPASAPLSFQGKNGTFIERRMKRKKKIRRPKGYRVLEVDTIVRYIDGVKRYILTGVDTERRTAFAAGYTNHGSASAGDFLRKARMVLPDCPSAIQTDKWFGVCASL